MTTRISDLPLPDRRGLGDRAGLPLPPGWRWVRLGDVIVAAQSGFASGARDSNGVIQLRMNNVDTRGRLIWDEFIRVPASESIVEKYALRPGDVVFNNTNSTELVGKSAFFDGHAETMVFSNHFTRLRVAEDQLDSRYLSLWLVERWQDHVFENLCNRWIGQSAVKSDKLLALQIPLPPLPEQKRIAAILNEQLAAVEKARAAAEAQLQAAKALPAAYLRDVFGSEEARRWPTQSLLEVCDLLPAHSIATDGDAEVLAITTACLTESGFDPSGVKRARMWAKNVEESIVSCGEILIARSNTPDLVGRVAMFAGEPKGAVASDLTIRLMPKRGLEPVFLAAYFSELYLRGHWKERAGGASGSMKKITRSQIQAEQVPAPPLDIQRRIAEGLAERMTVARQTRRALDAQTAAIEQLPAALLRRAFAGEV